MEEPTSIQVPVNVLALADTAPMHELQAIGINRLRLGPGMMKGTITVMKTIAGD